jgi:cytochrome c oxidase subunit 1
MFPGLAKWQPYLFGIGMAVFSLVMMGAGTLGVARRHWDMGFTGSALGYEYPGSAYILMGLVGVSGIVAIIGGAAYILITVGSVFFGKRIGVAEYKPDVVPLTLAPQPAIEAHGGGKGGFAAPGTFVLALLFLAIFVVYYAINWKYLASVWPLS